MLGQMRGSEHCSSGNNKQIDRNGSDRNANANALHVDGVFINPMARMAGYSNFASTSVPSFSVDANNKAIIINRNKNLTSYDRKYLREFKKFNDNGSAELPPPSTLRPLFTRTPYMRIQWRRRRQEQLKPQRYQNQKRKHGYYLILYPSVFSTPLLVSNKSLQSIQRKKMKTFMKNIRKHRCASKKQCHPKFSNQPEGLRTTTSTTNHSLRACGQRRKHNKANKITFNHKTSDNSVCMNNFTQNTNRNGPENNSEQTKINNPNLSARSMPLAICCSTFMQSDRKRSGNYFGNINTYPTSQMKERELLRSSSINRSVIVDYLHLLKKIIHFLLIVNCLAYVVDVNASMAKIGALGAITNNYSIVPSVTIAPILLPAVSGNRSSDPIAIDANVKNRKNGNSVRIESDDTDEDAQSPQIDDASNTKTQAQPRQHHYNHHRTHKNSNNPNYNHNENDESIGSDASSEKYGISPSASSHHFQKMASLHQSPHSVHHTHSSGVHSTHTSKQSTTSAVKNHQLASAAVNTFEQTTIPTSDSGDGVGDSEEYVGCASCQIREQLKAQNLASIKMHILARLAMSQPPNITTRPPISEHLIESFYSQNGFRYIRVKNNYHNDESVPDMNDMLGDDPTAYHTDIASTAAEYSHTVKDIQSHVQHHHHHDRHSSTNSIKKFDDIENVSHKYFNADNEYNDDFDAFDERGGIVYNSNYYDEVPPDFDDDADEAFYSITDSIYSYPKRKC